MRKILVLGGSGQIGFELQRTLSPFGVIVAPTRRELALNDLTATEAYLRQLKPSLVVNAAAWTAVDAAEEEREKAYTLNALLPLTLVNYCRAHEVKLVHYSSDYVYPGTGKTPWLESSETAPQNQYGKTKLAGDIAIANSGANYLLFRTSWVFSARGSNFMKTMLRLALTHDELSIVADQIGAPTPARLIAIVTALAIHKNLESGIYHLASNGECSWFEFAQKIFDLVQSVEPPKTLSLKKVHKIQTSDYKTPARRPMNSRLNLKKIENALDICLPTWESQLESTFHEYLELK